MGSTPYIGQVKCFAFGFAPRGWAQCNGQLLAISQNQALFSILGTTYGGNGIQNFALPDLRGRLPIHAGQGIGLSNRTLGLPVGTESTTLAIGEMPAHTHTVSACPREGDSLTPVGCLPAKAGTGDAKFGPTGQAGAGVMAANAVANGGSSVPHNNMMPYLGMNFCIALVGIFPPRT
jgi:microcystin-dependent protein